VGEECVVVPRGGLDRQIGSSEVEREIPATVHHEHL